MPLSNGFPVRNLLRGSFLPRILERARLILPAPKEKMAFYRQEFDFPGVFFDELPSLHDGSLERLFRFIENAVIHTDETRLTHWYHFRRRNTKTPFPVRLWIFFWRRLLWHLGQFEFCRRAVRFMYRFTAGDGFGELLNKHRPDLVFCPTLIYGAEYALILSAKRRGIRTLGMIASWDNLYSKTIIRVFPDELLTATDLLKNQAHTLCDFPKRKIEVVGLPQYDRYFSARPSSREEFIRNLGGDPRRKLIVYAFSGKIGVDVDNDMIRILHDILEERNLNGTAQVLVRPYPKLDFSSQRAERVRQRFGFLGQSSSRSVGQGKAKWEFDEAALKLQHDTLAHADVIISMYSTFFVEGAIFDKPLIAIAFDGNVPANQWNSVSNFFRWDHLRDLLGGGVRLVRSYEQFAEAVADALRNPAGGREGRKKIVESQCVFTDGKSAERVAKAVFELLSAKANIP